MNIVIATVISGVVALTAPKPMEEIRLEMVPARIIKMEKPAYPALAKLAQRNGEVIVRVRIESDGSISRTRIVKSAGPILDQVVTRAINEAHFAPAVTDSGPVASWLEIPFNFRTM
jgi:protein TonB